LNNGKDINVIGEVNVEGRQNFICPVTAFYWNDILITHVLISTDKFNINRDYVEVLNNEQTVHSGKIPEDNKSSSPQVQGEG